jgi:DNA invertase Pin-like site-specific DNA recombinase
MKHYISVRVSTKKQDYDQQLNTIKNYCVSNKIDFDECILIEETVSRRKNYKTRKVNQIFSMAEKGDNIIVSEFTRIGGNFRSLLEFIEDCRKAGVTLTECKNRMIIQPIEVQDIQTQMLIFVFGIGSQMELENIRQRTISGCQASKEKKGARNEKWGKEAGITIKEVASLGGKKAGSIRKLEANNDPSNMYICQNTILFKNDDGSIDFHALLMNMKSLNMKTSGGNEFTMNRLRCMYDKLRRKGLICI